MSLCIYFFVRLDWSYQRLSKPCRSQEHSAYVCGTERNRTGKKDTAGRDRHDLGDKERCSKAIVKRDEMVLAVSVAGVIPV